MVQESDINFHLLIYEVPVGIYVCDPTGTFIYANLALAELFGFERPGDIVGKNFNDFISPGRANIFMNQFRKSMLPGPSSTLITTRIKRRDGKTVDIEVNAMHFIKNRILLGNQGVVRDITELKQAKNKMMHASTHDPLTGIYNLTYFEAEMKRLERGRQYPISIIIVNIESLKNVSDSEDHKSRDKIIILVARQLFYSFRGDDIVARIGENEFGILFPNVGEKTVEEIIRRIQGDLLKINIDEGQPALEFYIGAGTVKSGEILNSALKRAEVIVYLKKKKNI